MTRSIPITHSVFDAPALGGLVATEFLSGTPAACELFSKSWTDVYRVFANDKVYAARVWRSGFHAAARIDYECRYLTWAGAQGLPVPVPHTTRDGGFTLTLDAPEGPRHAVLFDWVDGARLGSTLSAADAGEMGELLARLHAAGQHCPIAPPPPAAFERPTDEMAALERSLRHRTVDASAILGGVRRVAKRVAAAEQMEAPRGVIHGDFHANNVLRRADGGLFVIDFDDLSPGLLVRDIAACRWSMNRWNRADAPFDAFIAGYERLRPLLPVERDLIPLFLAERDAWVVRAWGANINMLGDAQGQFDASLDTALMRFAQFAG